MELEKLKELVAFLREANVAQYVDARVSIVLADYEEEPAEDEPKAVLQPPPVGNGDPLKERVAGAIPADYAKAFGIK